MAHYSAMKRNEVLIHATSMNLKNVNENDQILYDFIYMKYQEKANL
jgi:hypothetical protein